MSSRPHAGEAFLDWLDSRTGYRAGKRHLLEEPLPSGVGWWFVTGSVLLFLLVVQLLTGVVLSMYYVPSPEHAYDSVRFIMDRLPFGAIVRGLHVFGASFIVVAAVVHMLRVVLFASYKKPRELTWLTGVVLLLVILAFSLSGYLLPWDQKAYWATTVTINIARSTPFLGEQVASLLRGGFDLGALTLGRWYAAHVFLLPAALIGFVVAHLYLMRRHGISGPITERKGPSRPFYPYHALKDTIAIATVFALLLVFVFSFPAPLDEIADPSDAKYVPRPEWYFLSLFQLLKYFPGPLEPVATMVIPGLLVLALLLLPFLDRSAERRPLRRLGVTGAFAVVGLSIAALTWLGLEDSPAHADPDDWGPVTIAGRELAADERCVTCHREGGAAGELRATRMRRDPEWLVSHVQDPEMIAPGLRPAPAGGMNALSGRAVLAYMAKVRAGSTGPDVDEGERIASRVFGSRCANCHAIDGEGDPTAGGDLSRVGSKHDAKWLREWISDPATIDENADMPAFGDRLSDDEMTAIVNYLAARR
jgi:ubiquinol-cytochrome c reductase cytochrome b subunit